MGQLYQVKYLSQAKKFLSSLSDEVYDKIDFNVSLVLEGKADRTVFKKLEGHEIWEVRTSYKGQQYRLFTFFDKYSKEWVVATHAIVKKTQKVPLQEIRKAEKIMKQYYKDNYPNKMKPWK